MKILVTFKTFAKFTGFYLTNRFHVAVGIRSKMTSKCGKNKEVAHEPHEQ